MAKKKPASSTKAGKYVHDEIEAIRSGEHGAANAKQAIAIGLSKARRAGVKVGENPRRKKTMRKKRKASGESKAKRSRASLNALKKQPRVAAGKKALSRHAKAVGRRKK